MGTDNNQSPETFATDNVTDTAEKVASETVHKGAKAIRKVTKRRTTKTSSSTYEGSNTTSNEYSSTNIDNDIPKLEGSNENIPLLNDSDFNKLENGNSIQSSSFKSREPGRTTKTIRQRTISKRELHR